MKMFFETGKIDVVRKTKNILVKSPGVPQLQVAANQCHQEEGSKDTKLRIQNKQKNAQEPYRPAFCSPKKVIIMLNRTEKQKNQLMRLWYTRAVSPEPSLFAHMKNVSRRRVRPKIRHQDPLDGCTCALEE